MSEVLLEVKNLETCFDTDAGRAQVLDKVSFKIKKGTTVGIVGESGCGKSVTSLSVMRLLPKPAGHITGGEVLYKGKDITKIPAKEMRKIRGNKIAMIFQEPMTALNPLHRVGKQLGEVLELHHPEMSVNERFKICVDMIRSVGIPEPERRMVEFPHQLSGGIRQRVMIAMALLCKPDILIADEPTTALDVTIQAQILKLMKNMQLDLGMAIMFITHDLGVIAELCDEVVVMYAGRVVERGPVREIFKNPKHAYTKGLLSSIPRLETESKTKLEIIEGMVPSIFDFPVGCRFANRCPYAEDKCRAERPELVQVGSEHFSSCIKHSIL
ncbi:MAG: ABC transporter ATP-binding protein [Bacteriovoracaceae bacterium]|nr:ABC transporter ATP-binding protein [Bacteriovoracaceae bacterium]